ncbi:hypothetical protein ACFVQ3_04515 [Oerskovia sp. NPDC057915]|uniref:hypothetical protein n=1 Tax=Oerskovia sp. NPDC057915 TaxID=3346280 RepID=UPI0036DF27D1
MDIHEDSVGEDAAPEPPSGLRADEPVPDARIENDPDDWTKVVIDGGTSVPPFDPPEPPVPGPPAPARPVEPVVLDGSVGTDPFDPDAEDPS